MTPRDPFDLRFPDPPGPGAPGPRPSRRPPSAHPALRASSRCPLSRRASSPRPLSRRALLGGAGALALTSALASCGGGGDPLARDGASAAGGSGAIVVGSQQYYSNEIIAELYAQAIEHAGLTVTRQYQIGQREIYLPELESGAISVLPEYGGNLLQ